MHWNIDDNISEFKGNLNDNRGLTVLAVTAILLYNKILSINAMKERVGTFFCRTESPWC